MANSHRKEENRFKVSNFVDFWSFQVGFLLIVGIIVVGVSQVST